jgi:hypothetical protein
MKAFIILTFCLVLSLSFTLVGFSQDEVNCDQLRDKIAQAEKLDLNSMSPSIRQLYKESLLTLYILFSDCLQRDIAAADTLQKAASETRASQPIENKLKMLNQERLDADGKITLLRMALNPSAKATSLNIGTSQPTPGEAVGGSNVQFAGAANSPATNRNGSQGTSIQPPNIPPPPQAISSCAISGVYDDAPAILKDLATKSARDVVRASGDPNKEIADNAADKAIGAGSNLVLYTIFDAASPTSSKLVRKLAAYQYLAETARTDKQLGASQKSEGAVSAIEKPGFANLLGFAIEHGGITKKNDGTNLTLSTSLYSLYALKYQDTSESYDRAGILNRIGVSASFAVTNKTDDLANARRNNLAEWSVRSRLFGDRSTRSAGFQRFWDRDIRPLISDRLLALGKAVTSLSKSIKAYAMLENDALTSSTSPALPDLVKMRMECPDYKASATPDDKVKIIADVILSQMKTKIYDPIRSKKVEITLEEIELIEGEYLPDLKTALDNLVVGKGLLEQKIDNLQKSPLGTFAYTNHRQPNASDYSETKFLYEQEHGFLGPLKLTGNLGMSFYHRPDPTMKQQKLRDVSAALSFDGSTASPFTEAGNQSKITYSFVGSYQRLFENRRMTTRKPDIGTVQFVLEIPFVKGFSLPFSLSYANATEEERKKNVKFNFGMHLDTDKLFALLRAGIKQ